ncbi:hypothetical protein HK101_006728 [Irineochytrium annulatum]|nr:hypothetical protein HK101_006728 [Irineochytrium annulatum]
MTRIARTKTGEFGVVVGTGESRPLGPAVEGGVTIGAAPCPGLLPAKMGTKNLVATDRAAEEVAEDDGETA